MEELPKKFGREKDKGIFKKGISSVPSLFSSGWEWHMSAENAQSNFNAVKEILENYNVNLEHAKILEVGSGNATFLSYMKKQGINAVGTDIRPRGNKDSPQIRALIEQLPFADESFDVILSFSVFDKSVYKQDQNRMMKEITRVLKPGGIYVGFEDVHKPGESKSLKKLPLSSLGLNIYRKS